MPSGNLPVKRMTNQAMNDTTSATTPSTLNTIA